MTTPWTKPEDILKRAAALYESRNKEYADSYRTFGEFVSKLFPQGLTLQSPEDFARWGVLSMMLSKIHRYAKNFENGHPDSLLDLSVYSAMMLSLDQDRKCQP